MLLLRAWFGHFGQAAPLVGKNSVEDWIVTGLGGPRGACVLWCACWGLAPWTVLVGDREVLRRDCVAGWLACGLFGGWGALVA